MKISLSNFTGNQAISVLFSESVSLPDKYNVVSNNNIVNVEGTVTKNDDVYCFDGKLIVDLILSCDRCLNDVAHCITCNIHEEFTDNLEKAEVSEYDMYFFEGKDFDLVDAIGTNLLLHMPLKVVCNDDCKGLCCICGQDLNTGTCNCDENAALANSKFSSLRSLFQDKEV